jgi:hypothetical protein
MRSLVALDRRTDDAAGGRARNTAFALTGQEARKAGTLTRVQRKQHSSRHRSLA